MQPVHIAPDIIVETSMFLVLAPAKRFDNPTDTTHVRLAMQLLDRERGNPGNYLLLVRTKREADLLRPCLLAMRKVKGSELYVASLDNLDRVRGLRFYMIVKTFVDEPAPLQAQPKLDEARVRSIGREELASIFGAANK